MWIDSCNCYCWKCHDSSSVCHSFKQEGQIGQNPAMCICDLYKESRIQRTEAALHEYSWEKVFEKYAVDLQENTHAEE